MTTELLETIADLEARVDELEEKLSDAKYEIAELERRVEDEEQIGRDYKELLLDIKLTIINAL